MNAANFASLCSSSSRGVFNTQSPASGTQGLAYEKPTKKRKKEAKITRVFKEEWAALFPWVELVVDLVSKTHMVHCKVCYLVENKDKILNPKLDGLQKHARKRKSLIYYLGVWLMGLILAMITNIKEMKGLMLVGV